MNKYKVLCLHQEDNIAVALSEIPEQTTIQLEMNREVVTVNIVDKISFGHKFAIKQIREGEDIKKYGEVIGIATCDIMIGEHVHIHNLQSKQGRDTNGRKDR